jgi:hypothetical protein
LTYSIIETMAESVHVNGSGTISAISGSAHDSVSFPEIAGNIIKFARVEAERMHITQTPVFLGSIQGGLAFPLLRRGENYRAAFPSLPTKLVSGDFEELAGLGLSAEVVSNWKHRFPAGLNALQLKAVNEYGILQGQSLLVVAPTSSGKTMIGELAAIQAVAEGKKAAFLLPYRALVHEKYQEFTARYGSAGLRVVRCSGDASDGVPSVLSGRYDLGFFTYETFLNLALASPRLLNQLGLLVLDEGQFITDPSRGITVELILALLLRVKERGVETSAVRPRKQPYNPRSGSSKADRQAPAAFSFRGLDIRHRLPDAKRSRELLRASGDAHLSIGVSTPQNGACPFHIHHRSYPMPMAIRHPREGSPPVLRLLRILRFPPQRPVPAATRP